MRTLHRCKQCNTKKTTQQISRRHERTVVEHIQEQLGIVICLTIPLMLPGKSMQKSSKAKNTTHHKDENL